MFSGSVSLPRGILKANAADYCVSLKDVRFNTRIKNCGCVMKKESKCYNCTGMFTLHPCHNLTEIINHF